MTDAAPTPIRPEAARFVRGPEDSPQINLADRPHTRLLAECVASQQQAGYGQAIDIRLWLCPRCRAPGYNTGWGYIRFACKAEWIPGDPDLVEPCAESGTDKDTSATPDMDERLRIALQELRRARDETAVGFNTTLHLTSEIGTLRRLLGLR